MLKLFVFPTDRNSRLCKFFIVTILFFISVLLAVSSGHAFDGPGLYKDGEKVLGFDLAPSDEADIALNATKTMAEKTDRKRKILPENMADADSFSEQKNYIKTLLECKKLITTIKEKLEQGKDIDEESDLLIKKGEDLVQANLEIIRKFDEIERECQERGYSQTILDRHAQMVQEHKEGVHELLRLLKNLEDHSGKEGLSNKIEKLHKFFSDKKFKEDPPLVNAQALPVNIMKMEAPVVQAVKQEAPVDIRRLDPTFEKKGLPAEVKSEKTPVTQKDIRIKGPGDIDISAAPPTQDDLDPTIDVQFTQDITDLANSLNNSPLKMYEYVKNNFEFEPYLGSRKGSQETLNHRSGNDYDLSSLLIALFRISNIPARYATGIVEMTQDRAKNWLGVKDAATAGGILTTAGMEGVNIMDGTEVVAIQCRRVWVEAYIPYTNYRGIGNDDTGKMWVPMDPAFKQYDYQAGIDIPEEMGFDAEAFVDDYISTFHEDSPVELYKQQIIDYLAVNYPDLTYEDILRTRSLRDEVLGIISGSLPYKLLSRDGEYSEIASDKRYQIRFHIHGSGATLNYTANLPEIAGKQVTISYIGATAADQQVIDDSGGIYGVLQPWLVNLKPVLKVDGCDVAIGSGQVTMGIKQDSDMYFTPPTGAQNVVPAVYNKITAGSYQGIGIDTWNVVTNFFAPMSTSCEESYTGYLLHDTAMKYLGRVNASNNEVGKTMQIVVMNDVAEAIVEHVVDVSYDLWGAPLTFEWSGLIVDADRSITGSFSVTGDDESCEFMRLTGADGSNLENRIFEDGFDEPAVSTIKILELASDMSIPIYEFDGTPCSTIYSSLNQPSYVEDAICTAVAGGHVVTIPRDPITYYDWTGTGYIDMKANCAAGYIISGGRSGGATVKDWDIDMSGVYCLDATVSNIEPSTPTHTYYAGDTRCLEFEVFIEPYDKDCNHLIDYFRTFSTGDPPDPMTIKDIADNYGAGVYTFTVGSIGGCAQCGMNSRDITIATLDKLTLTDSNNTSKKKEDSTPEEDSTPSDDTLYLYTNSSGIAQMNMDLTWKPPSVLLAEIGSKLKYKLEKKTGTEVVQNWSFSSVDFSSGKVNATWTKPASGTPNREFKVTAWFDIDEDGIIDSNEEVRLLFITIGKISLKEVSFKDYYEVRLDDDSDDYDAPHWQDNDGDGDANDSGDRKYPVIYVRDTKAKIEAKFNIDPVPSNVTIKVKGDGNGNLDILETSGSISSDTVTLGATYVSNAFGNTVDYLNPMAIKWELSFDGGSSWHYAGTSKNEVFVPLVKPSCQKKFRTVMYLACKNTGGTNADNIVTPIWSEFADRIVNRADGTQLIYWDGGAASATDTAGLLKDGNGQCGSWAEFFIECLKVHGISGIKITIVEKSSPMVDLFLVKNWSFAGTGVSLGTAPYVYVWGNDANNEPGVAGQGNAEPPEAFYNHFIVRFNNKYYDPSYGSGPFADQVSWENSSLDGFAKKGIYSGHSVWLIKKNDSNVLETEFITP